MARPPRRSRVAAALRWLTGTLTVTVVTVLLAAPFVAVPALGIKAAVTAWETMPTDLPVADALPQRVRMTTVNGDVFATLYTENRVPVDLDDVSPWVPIALLATEDARFYDHGGVDLVGLGRAAVNNLTGGARQGGSSITQQYVKNILLYAGRTQTDRTQAVESTLARKLREARYAIALETTRSKQDILTDYLNTVYFGNSAYGIEAAARRYFSTSAAYLNLAQAATLIGILKSTSAYNPVDHPAAALTRRDTVLDRIAATPGAATSTELDTARATPLALNLSTTRNGCGQSRYPIYCQWVKETILTNPIYGETADDREAFFARGGFTITTALDPTAQDAATAAATRALGPHNRVSAAIATVTPGTGHVTALASNTPFGQNPGETELLLPILPAFQPGSTFKPFVLATAFEQGIPTSVRFDTPNGYKPATMNYPTGGFSNDDNSGHGVLDARGATARSVNTWFVQLIEQAGVTNTADMATRLGITSLPRTGDRAITNRDASLALGAFEVSPLDMATAYATFAAHGVMCQPTGITAITRTDGTAEPVPNPNCHQAIAPEIADTVTDILTAPITAGTAAGLGLPGRPAAGKTGTTNDHAATWFVGFTPQAATAVWVGDKRGGHKYPLTNVSAYGATRNPVYGSTIAGPIWHDTMTAIHTDLPVKPFPTPGPITATAPAVPNLTGLTPGAADTQAATAGYTLTINPATPPTNPANTVVLAQDPPAGAQQAPDTAITVTLGTPPTPPLSGRISTSR